MILWPGDHAPLILKAGAGALLFLHIGGGGVGILSGFASMIARKGGRLHSVAGTTFFVSMLSMAGVGAAVAPLLKEDPGRWANTVAGVFTLYLLGTSWMTVRRRPGEVGTFERVALVVPLGLILAALAVGASAGGAATPAGAAPLYAFAVFSAVAAGGDLQLLRSGGLAGAARLARHLWRMGLSLFIAAGSFFLGQPKFLPAAVRDTVLPLVPPLAAIALLLFWLVKVRWPRRRRRAPTPALA
ncbi:MAG: hypothetical protein JF588_15535 [Caulobacterales bacterium]|nr:hypothetical protein [Caulobacterales bacterium]